MAGYAGAGKPQAKPKRTVIDRTADYELTTGRFEFVEGMEGRDVYGITNLKTRIVEAVGPNLASAISALYRLQHDLDSARELVQQIKEQGYDDAVGEEDDSFTYGNSSHWGQH